MPKKAIIFGSIGTIVETSELQRAAFNVAFLEAGLDWHWTKDAYAPMLAKSGGKKRIAEFADQRGESVDADKLHSRKTEIFNEKMIDDGLTPRPGVVPLVHYAKQNGIKLGFATTTSHKNIETIFTALNGVLNPNIFEFVGNNEIVNAPKPDPEIYTLAMTAMDVSAAQCIAIEDTPISMQAATAAGIDCVAFPGAFANREAFAGAVRIVDRVEPLELPGLSS